MKKSVLKVLRAVHVTRNSMLLPVRSGCRDKGLGIGDAALA